MDGILAWFARNRVAANLLMLMIILAGFLAIGYGVRRELFPLVSLDMVHINVVYPGATPVEVEEGIVLPIEEAVGDLEGIDELNATAAEGFGTVTIKVRSDYDTRSLMSDVKTRLDGITTFPQDAEEPVIEELSFKFHVITVVVSSDTIGELGLRTLAEQFRDELLAVRGITQVKMGAVRPYEIGIHVSEESLRRHGLTFDEVAGAVRVSSLNLPAGEIRATGGDILIRTQSQAYRGDEFENLVLLTNPDGTRVRLSDVATIVDGFEEDERWARFDGRPAVTLAILAPKRENISDVVDGVRSYIATKRPSLPAGVNLDTWFDFSRYYTERQELMLRNGLNGLILVFLCLAFFLHLRLAFWVAVGLLLSFLGAFAVMWYFDVSLNLISMAAFILVLGIVVDDAIVVSESIHHKQTHGEHGVQGAVSGVIRVSTPVIFAVLTSVIAFLPMLAISGVDGKMWRIIPIVIVACLLLSLVESLLILPAHLSHEPSKTIPWYLFPIWPLVWLFEQVRRIVEFGLQAFVRRVYVPVLNVALSWRYTTLAVFSACLIVTIGLLAGGRVPYAFSPRLPGDVATATLEMPHGTSAATTRAVLKRIEDAAEQLRDEIDDQNGGVSLVKHILVAMGSHPVGDAQNPLGLEGAGGPHLAEATIEFQNLVERNVSSEATADRWRELVGTVPGVRQLTFNATEGHEEKDIHIRLTSHNIDHVEAAASQLKEALRRFNGIYEISDTLGSRRQEVTLAIKPTAETLGLRSVDLARQVRQAFYGEEAQRIQRGRDDIRVMVRYPRTQRASLADLERMRIRTQSGDEVPLGEVADIQYGEGLASISRADRRRMAEVTAMIDRKVIDNVEHIMEQLESGVLADVQQRYPGLSHSREGGMKNQERVLRELIIGFVVALFAMYATMAIAFKSYLQPALIASAIPFGLVGAVAGHVLCNETFNIVSFLGMVALAGVVVNDSLVLVDYVNRLVRGGMPVREAVPQACQHRFRAILLTSLTTFFGLTPLMAETSVQARFIIPMAITLAYGVAFATLITLTLVPSLYLMIDDATRLWRRLTGLSLLGEDVEPPRGGSVQKPVTLQGHEPEETIATATEVI
ncbi:MAG: efflux RND transporter permease subunit [Planctomycetes bacterium]|nr:efflux RND transporter permease subunit [Planctomycetota bacterium]